MLFGDSTLENKFLEDLSNSTVSQFSWLELLVLKIFDCESCKLR